MTVPDTMTCWQVTGPGEPLDVMTLAEVPVPVPGPGEVLVEVWSAALNFPDVLLARGTYQERPEPPFTPGVELAPGIRVNAVAPAVIRTRFAGNLYQGREEEVAKGYPLGRLGDPDDVAPAVAFLASDDAAWITGQTVIIDGGLTLTGSLS